MLADPPDADWPSFRRTIAELFETMRAGMPPGRAVTATRLNGESEMYSHRKFLPVLLPAIALVTIAATVAAEEAPEERRFGIEAQSPQLYDLVDRNAQPELLGDRYGLTEGPLWMDDEDGGFLLFTDMISNVIYRWTPGHGTSVFLDEAGYSGDNIDNAGFQAMRGRMRVILIGPNGLTLDPQGRVVWCAMPDRRVMRLEADGTRTVVAEKYDGKRFSGPNDVVYRSDGTLYFTDSIFGLRGAEHGRQSPYRELPFNGVFMVRNGTVSLLVKDAALGGDPNGIALSPDEKYLYVSADYNRIMRYELNDDGTLGAGSVFRDGETSDGMKVDRLGNVYTTAVWEGEVRITSPEGKRLGVIRLPGSSAEPQAQVCATNLAFGDADSKGLYITACEHVYRLQMKVAGIRPASP
jgi:gluconolactonase